MSPYPLVSGSPGLPVSEAWAAYQQARELANHGQLAAARGWCQRALEQDPLLVEAHYTLALIYQEEGVLELAIDQFRKTLYLAPDFVLAHLSLAHLYQQAGRRNEADRHHAQTLHLAAQQPPDEVLPGSDGLTAGRLLTMVQGSL